MREAAVADFFGTTDQFAKPGILPRFASERARQSRTTFVATSICVLVAAAHPCAGAVLQTARLSDDTELAGGKVKPHLVAKPFLPLQFVLNVQ